MRGRRGASGSRVRGTHRSRAGATAATVVRTARAIGSVRALVATTLLAAALVAGPSPAAGAEPARVAAFFYPWWGTPGRDGGWLHWGQRGAQPPRAIASAFWPARGLYSSANPLVLDAQMRELRAARVDQVVSSWWGRGSVEDGRLPAVLAAARAHGLDVAAHVEPYPGRTPATTAADVDYLRAYGIRDVYVYGPHDATAESWAAALAPVAGVRAFAQTALAGFAARAGFDGVYTYDILTYGGNKFRRLCDQARRVRLVCAPSVGPGYDARRAVGDARVKPRRAGRTYDSMWRAALHARADVVTITSYNEWHEGTQIEPAVGRRVPGAPRHRGYDGAWGLTGRAAQTAYLARTAHWSSRLRAGRQRRQ